MIGKGTVYLEDMAVGQSAETRHIVTERDIDLFAEVSGDDNPIHVDEAFAVASRFGGRIAHGLLSASYISAILGTRMPGVGTIYLSQSLAFKAPVKIGDEVRTTVTVEEIDRNRGRVRLSTNCFVSECVVLEGEALVLAPKKPQ